MAKPTWLSAVGAAGLAALIAAPVVPARAGDLQAACFAPSALAAREGEKQPQRGARGAQQKVPDIPLPTAQPVAPNLRGVIRRVTLPKGRKLVALTFDLCEQPGEIAGYDGAIFDYLRANKVRATLFVGGKWMMTHPERTRQLIADGLFEIGDHGWAHRNVRGLAGADLMSEIRGPMAAYRLRRAELEVSQCAAPFAREVSRIPQRLGLYRFPYGACNPAALGALAGEGLLAVQWDVSTGDPTPATSAAAIARALTHEVKPGSIVLAHANGRGYHTAEALPLAIPKLKAMGYEFVTVSELLRAGEPQIVPTCDDSRPGDTDRYDRLFAARRETVRERAPTPAAAGGRSRDGWTAVPR